MSGLDIIIIVAAVIVAVVAGLYFLNKWAYQKMDTQQQMINNVKTLTNMYVIDKKKAKITEVNMPKVVTENMPKMESRMPTAAISIGAMTALNCMSTSPPAMNAAAPNAEVARMEPQ